MMRCTWCVKVDENKNKGFLNELFAPVRTKKSPVPTAAWLKDNIHVTTACKIRQWILAFTDIHLSEGNSETEPSPDLPEP